jgi:hypothetical protein
LIRAICDPLFPAGRNYVQEAPGVPVRPKVTLTLVDPSNGVPHGNAMDAGVPLIGDMPSMPRLAAAFLRRRLERARCFLEYGAGGSTVLAARSGVARIYSVESDPAYAQAVEARVRQLREPGVLRSHSIDIGPTGGYGYPTDASRIDDWPRYATEVWEAIAAAGDVPDVILVDGRFRVACCLQSFLHMSAEAVLVFDDYFDREDRYGIVTRFAPVRRQVKRVAVFRRPDPLDAEAIRAVLADYAANPA